MDEASPNYSKIMEYIDNNPAAVLGSVNADGTPHTAVVYVCTASHQTVCFVTKKLTQKYKNILVHPLVSISIFNERDSSTLQATGRAYAVDDPRMKQYVTDRITKIHALQAEWLPPIDKLEAGEYSMIGVELTSARLAQYRGLGNSSEDIFTEL